MRVYFYIVFTLIAGCGWQDSSNYCPGNPHNNCKNEPGTCDTDDDCSGQASICSAGGRCVQCTTERADACTGDTPVCSAAGACSPCSEHVQCSETSNVCLPSGACADADDVAYVEAGRTGGPPCGQSSPCGTLAQGLASDKPNVKITGALVESVETTIEGRNVDFLAAPRATLDRMNDGGILRVRGNANVSIHDLEITGQGGASDTAVTLEPAGGSPRLTLVRAKITGGQGGGLTASGGTLTVQRSEIANNGGGGILMTNGGTVIVVNSFIHHNRSESSASGGGLTLRPIGASRVEFNTIVDNSSSLVGTSAGGVFCDAPGFVADNNIIFRNIGGTSGQAQTVGQCAYGRSLVMPGATPADESLRFVKSNEAPFDYHLTAASPSSVMDAAGSCTGEDADGDVRPRGGACDLGADEFTP